MKPCPSCKSTPVLQTCLTVGRCCGRRGAAIEVWDAPLAPIWGEREMKTCPYCGGIARIVCFPCFEGYAASGYCETCGLTGPYHAAEDQGEAEAEARAMWDRLPRKESAT